MKKKGFTLVELLAVIVILAVILVIAVPQILNTIKSSKLNSIKASALLVATTAEKSYLAEQTLNNNYKSNRLPCSNVVKLSNDYASCTVNYDEEGIATITLVGKDKFDKIICSGTKDNMNCSEGEVKYTVRRSLTSSSTTWERLDDNVGKVANATKDGSSVVNDFDNIYPWSGIITYDYNTSTGEEIEYGDSRFTFDGTNGEVLTRIPEFYYKREQKDGYEYVSISPYQLEGYELSNEFSVGRYDSSYDGTKLHSISNTLPEVSRTITSFRTLSQAVGDNFGQMDYHYFLLQLLYLVEYADYNSQNKLGNGLVEFRYSNDDKALIAENNKNRIVIDTARAGYFTVGQYIHIGTSIGNTSIARYRKITKIEDYENDDTKKAIYFDGYAVNIAVDNVIFSSAQPSGGCDLLGMKSGTLNNDSKHCMIYRGIENIYGNVWQFVDGINIKDNVAYVNMDPSTKPYVVDTFTSVNGYTQIGYTNANTNGWTKTLGYDSSNSLIGLPKEVVGSSSTTADYYYQNPGNRIALVGGDMAHGTAAGLWSWSLNPTSGASYFYIGARLLRY